MCVSVSVVRKDYTRLGTCPLSMTIQADPLCLLMTQEQVSLRRSAYLCFPAEISNPGERNWIFNRLLFYRENFLECLLGAGNACWKEHKFFIAAPVIASI